MRPIAREAWLLRGCAVHRCGYDGVDERFDLDRIDVRRDESSRQPLFRADRNGVICEIAVSDGSAHYGRTWLR